MMSWAGTSINPFGLPEAGRRVGLRWIEDESLYWNYDEDVYGDLS